jgi:hypothetical protein
MKYILHNDSILKKHLLASANQKSQNLKYKKKETYRI